MSWGPKLLLYALVATTSAGCQRGEPPRPEGIDTSVARMPGPSRDASAGAQDAGGAAMDAGAAATASATGSAAARELTADAGDPGRLPQTRERPAASSEALDARATALWNAIARDEPELGMASFFPLAAYAQVKAVASPEADWRRRLVSAFERDVHALSKKLGASAASAKFVRITVPDERARWIEPDEEWNKIGYWRVYGARIIYVVDGMERSFDITSMIAWRGEWYVVHLTGFK